MFSCGEIDKVRMMKSVRFQNNYAKRMFQKLLLYRSISPNVMCLQQLGNGKRNSSHWNPIINFISIGRGVVSKCNVKRAFRVVLFGTNNNVLFLFNSRQSVRWNRIGTQRKRSFTSGGSSLLGNGNKAKQNWTRGVEVIPFHRKSEFHVPQLVLCVEHFWLRQPCRFERNRFELHRRSRNQLLTFYRVCVCCALHISTFEIGSCKSVEYRQNRRLGICSTCKYP